jgi:ribosomal protein L40E
MSEAPKVGATAAVAPKSALGLAVFRACKKCGAANPKGKPACPSCGHASLLTRISELFSRGKQ